MTEQDLIAQDYLRPPAGSAWDWSSDGSAIEWKDGGTIAFRPEIVDVLRRLAEGGLPPFDSIVLVLASCRNTWQDHRNLLSELLKTTKDKFLVHAVNELLSRLDSIYELPAELRSEAPARLELLATIFERYPHRASKEASWQIVSALVRGLECESIPPRVGGVRTSMQVKERRLLSDALARVDEAALRLRLKTGIEQVVVAPPEEVPQQGNRPLTVYELLMELEKDAEHAGLVRLVRNLLAVTYLPRRIDEPMELAMGGVSDITNRGPYDRLLISELAHDDDTLMTRIALNEALYLRRETPPSNPSQTRIVLIDCGIRMWGLPRLYAIGVGLSLAAQRGFHGETLLFHPLRDRFEPIDLTTKDGIVNHLTLLRPELHFGEVLEEFAKLAKELTAETVLVTCEDVWRDSEFRKMLRESGIVETFVFTVERSGRIRAFRQTVAGEKPIREANLDLDSFLSPKVTAREVPKPLPLRVPNESASLSEFFRFAFPPLRIPHHIRWKQAWYQEGIGLGSVTNDGQLAFWDQQGRGPKILCDSLPARRLLWTKEIDVLQGGACVLGQQGTRKLWLVKFNIDAARPPAVEWTELLGIDHAVLGVAHHREILFVIGRRDISEFSLASGQKIASWTLPAGVQWTGQGRFFRKGWELHAMASGSTLEKICSRVPTIPAPGEGFGRVRWTAIEGPDGPVAVDEGGTLYNSADDSMKRIHPELKGPVKVSAIDALGTTMLVQPRDIKPVGNSCLVRPSREQGIVVQVKRVPHVQQSVTMFERNWFPWLISLRKNVSEVAVSGGLLRLRTRRGQILQLSPSLTFEVLLKPGETVLEAGKEPLKPVPGWKRQYSLTVAEWPGGSRVYLDGRGLLHFVSSDRSLPQVSLILHDHLASGWSSDGRYWGSNYFHLPDEVITPVEVIWREVVQPVLRTF